MPNVQISDLPAALPLDGSELIPIVQSGVTVRTTTGQVAGSPNQQQTFLTKNQEPSLPNSRYLSTGTGLGLTDNGALSPYQLTLNGASGSLETASTGIIAKTVSNTVVARSLAASGAGLSVSNADGTAGNPTFQLTGIAASLANLGGTGMITIQNGTSVGSVDILGVTNQISVANGDGNGNPTIGIATNPILPGLEGVVLPQGTTAERPPVPNNGELRYNTDTQTFEGYANGVWGSIAVGAGVTSIDASGGTTGLVFTGGPITSSGVLTLSGTLDVDSGGTGANTLTGYVKGNGTAAMTANATVPTTDLSGTVSNAQLTNDSITINGNTVALGGSTTVTASTISALTIGTGLSGTSFDGSSPVTIAIDSTVVTLDGTQTLTNKTLTEPKILNTWKLTGSGASAYTPFAQTFASSSTNYNGYQLNYIQNVNNGSDASVDYVAYNDASDVDSYFIDMGISSSNYTNPIYTVFPPNSGYLYTGGGLSGQASALLLGTSNAASDIIMFSGGTLASDIRATIKGNTGNVLINTSTDTGYKLNVNGTTYFSGASLFGNTLTLNQDPTSALEAATKQYVDQQTSAGIHIHAPVLVETTGNLTASYTQGGTTFNITAITGGNTITTSVSHGLSVNNQIWLYTSAGNGLSTNTAYFVYSTPAANQLTLSTSYGGSQLTGLTNATGLTYNTRANSGIGAKLTNSGAQTALIVDGVTLASTNRVMVRLQTDPTQNGVYTVTDIGSGSTNWELTRATDANYFSPQDPNGLGEGDYFYTQSGILNSGDSHVLTTPGNIIIGYTGLTYTQFSGAITYTGGTNIDITGQVISLTGTVAATNGGTGTNTVATGDLLYGSAANTWSKLPLGIAYKSLIVNASGTQVEWNAIPLNQTTAVSGQLNVSNGGTGLSAYTTGDLIYASGSTTLTQLTIGASGYVLTSSGTAPQYVAQSTLSVGSATNAVNTGTTIDSTNATNYLVFKSATTGNLPELVNSSITCNPSTGKITNGIAGGTF